MGIGTNSLDPGEVFEVKKPVKQFEKVFHALAEGYTDVVCMIPCINFFFCLSFTGPSSTARRETTCNIFPIFY